MSDETEDLRRQVAHWRNIAIWLADCHGATAAYEGHLSRTSQSSRDRFAGICREAATMLREGVFMRRESDIHDVIQRCTSAADGLRTKPEKEGAE
jgi:hypothetical protein